MKFKIRDRSLLATRIKKELPPIINHLQSILDDIGSLEGRIDIPSIISSIVVRVGLKLRILPGKIDRMLINLSEDMIEGDYVIPPTKYVIMFRNHDTGNHFRYHEFKTSLDNVTRFLRYEFYNPESAVAYVRDVMLPRDYNHSDIIVIGVVEESDHGIIRKSRTIARFMLDDRR